MRTRGYWKTKSFPQHLSLHFSTEKLSVALEICLSTKQKVNF